MSAEQEGWAAYAAEQERHAETARRLEAVEALVESWPHGDNGQDYRAAVTQCRAAVLAAIAADSTPCIAPPGNLCTDTGCWDMDRCVVRPAAPFWCYPCSRGEHDACKGIAWQPDVECECAHDG